MSVHDPVKKFVCPFKDITGCDKAFGRPDKLKEHVLKHTKINVDTVTSLPRSAHATSSSVVLLTKHAKSADGDSDKLCKHCKTCRFESKEELLTHEILCAQVPRLKCEKCDLTFNTDESFDQHQCKPIMETLKISQVNSIKVNHLKKRSMKRKKLNRIELSPPRVKTSRRSKRLPADVEDESPSVQTPTKEVAAELTQNNINTVAN
ncbi:hypothetical protein EB796_010096 [Bugula neritina]|uniref:C2H2-type domain-containing protein n=1 Tax=Bugula neritina TaxID=10212 RepID=A0A7J7JYX0_BUGNE|nr:hypothetical protein EB796_010096 [Bugula neritina]